MKIMMMMMMTSVATGQPMVGGSYNSIHQVIVIVYCHKMNMMKIMMMNVRRVTIGATDQPLDITPRYNFIHQVMS